MYITDTFDNNEDNECRKNGEENMESAAELKEKITQSDWLTTGEAKKLLGVSTVNTMKRWVAEGKLEGRRLVETTG